VKDDRLRQALRWWSDFASLPPGHPAIAALAAASQMRTLDADEVLVNEGDDDGTVFLVVSGLLRTVRHTRNGHEVWYADVEPGDLTGDMAALTGARRTSSVVATNAVSVFAIDQDAFLAVAGTHADFALALAKMLAHRLQRTSKHLAELVALPVSTRLHGELAAMGTPVRGDDEVFEITSPPKVMALSQRIHATREATSRALADLQKRGLLKRTRTLWRVIVPVESRMLSTEARTQAPAPTLPGEGAIRRRAAQVARGPRLTKRKT
jgi:CRP/FNR family cyclic AMP-dependent transcriptional regulator